MAENLLVKMKNDWKTCWKKFQTQNQVQTCKGKLMVQ